VKLVLKGHIVVDAAAWCTWTVLVSKERKNVLNLIKIRHDDSVRNRQYCVGDEVEGGDSDGRCCSDDWLERPVNSVFGKCGEYCCGLRWLLTCLE
jgi:hypothetical protein